MDPGSIAMMIPIVAIISGTVLKMARVKAAQEQGPASAEMAARLDALEQDVQALQQGLSETHERLDFAERLLVKAREEKQISD
jgi:hypothetical protein